MIPFFPAAAAMLALYFVFRKQRYVHPEGVQEFIRNIAASVALIASFLGIMLFPSSEFGARILIGVLLLTAASAPILGLVERRHKPGKGIFKGNKEDAGIPWKRFGSHLFMNIFGALVVSALLWLAVTSLPSRETLVTLELLVELILPVSAYAILEFVRQDQLAHFPDMDLQYATLGPKQIEEDLRGYSLAEWHQFTNTVYLTLALFIASGSILFGVFGAQVAHHQGNPLPISWLFAFSAMLFFLFLFASSWNESEAVYATFIWGTLLVLFYYVLWFIFLDKSPLEGWGTAPLLAFAGVLMVYSALSFRLWYRYRKKHGSWKGFWGGLWSYSIRFLVIAGCLGVLMASLHLQLWTNANEIILWGLSGMFVLAVAVWFWLVVWRSRRVEA